LVHPALEWAKNAMPTETLYFSVLLGFRESTCIYL